VGALALAVVVFSAGLHVRMRVRKLRASTISEPWTDREASNYLTRAFDQNELKAIAQEMESGEQIHAATSWERLVTGGTPIPQDHNLRVLLTDRRLLVVDSLPPGGPVPSSNGDLTFHSMCLDDVVRIRKVHRDRQERTSMLKASNGINWKIKAFEASQSLSDKKFVRCLHKELAARRGPRVVAPGTELKAAADPAVATPRRDGEGHT
jgi:hypothetical protein